MLSLEITSIKNMRLFLEVADQLGYERTRSSSSSTGPTRRLGIRVADVEHSIGRKVDHTIVSDGRSVVYALNRGVPFFLSQPGGPGLPGHPPPGARRSPASGRQAAAAEDAARQARRKSLFSCR